MVSGNWFGLRNGDPSRRWRGDIDIQERDDYDGFGVLPDMRRFSGFVGILASWYLGLWRVPILPLGVTIVGSHLDDGAVTTYRRCQ